MQSVQSAAFGSSKPRFTETMSPTFQPKLGGPATYYTTVSSNSKKPTTLLSISKSMIDFNKNKEKAHYRLNNKQESYSTRGFGNGFASQGDRFTGINELKFY